MDEDIDMILMEENKIDKEELSPSDWSDMTGIEDNTPDESEQGEIDDEDL